MQNLPIGIQEFAEIRNNNLLYVDKTEYLFHLITEGKTYFLSRPRRFGKSLLVNTLKEIFLGNKHLFEGLWIYDKIDWTPSPVITIDFSGAGYRDIGLSNAIDRMLQINAQRYGIELHNQGNAVNFSNLIIELSQKFGKVAILIDEYDKPIIDYLNKVDIAQAQQNRETLKSFYSVLKGNDKHIRFLFLTGVSKFSKVSIFSDLNHLRDISLEKDYAAMLGYTQQELLHYFNDWIELMSAESSKEDLLKQIKDWYNGYSWDGKESVYNPFSVLNLFAKKSFENYWFSTGTPTFLIKLIKERDYLLPDIETIEVDADMIDKYEIETLELLPLLFQTGYLTIKSIDREAGLLLLDYPNREVKKSMSSHLLSMFNSQNTDTNGVTVIKMARCLQRADIETFMTLLETMFCSLVYQNIERKEAYFHTVFFLIARMLGYVVKSEVQTATGRVDAVIDAGKYVFIIEFKITSADEAIEQIKTMAYHKPFLGMDKEISLVGIGFNADTKKIRDWKIEKV